MKVKLLILIIFVLFIAGLAKVDNITNSYLGKTDQSLGESIKNDINNILTNLQKNR